MEWKDITSYSQRDKDKIPRILECKLSNNISVIVHKHIYYENEWLLSCKFLGYNCIQLGTEDIKNAQTKAIVRVKDGLTKMNNLISDVILSIEQEKNHET